MIKCIDCQKRNNDFLEDKLSFNDERKFIYHIDTCKKCFDELLEEYIFYVSYNDLDKNLNLNYRDSLINIINEKKYKIITDDKKITKYYIFISIGIIIICVNILALFVKFI